MLMDKDRESISIYTNAYIYMHIQIIVVTYPFMIHPSSARSGSARVPRVNRNF